MWPWRGSESIEKHSLDTGVIMEELQMTRAGNGAAGVHVDAGSAMGGECDLMRLADCRSRQKSGDALGSRGIGLLTSTLFEANMFSK